VDAERAGLLARASGWTRDGRQGRTYEGRLRLDGALDVPRREGVAGPAPSLVSAPSLVFLAGDGSAGGSMLPAVDPTRVFEEATERGLDDGEDMLRAS
jgi:hypothetical protein